MALSSVNFFNLRAKLQPTLGRLSVRTPLGFALVAVHVDSRIKENVSSNVSSLFHRQKNIYFPQLFLINQQNQLDLSNKTFGSILGI